MEAELRTARVRVQAQDFWCEGDVVVPKPSAYRSRVHDVFNRSEEFLALTDVTLGEEDQLDTEDAAYYDVLILRKGEIKFVIPLD